MDREILFRGKRIDSGEWVEGYYTFYPQGFSGKCKPETVIRDTWELVGRLYFVDPETVCQYTGLTDKNGRKIFEGDICEFSVFDYNGCDTQYKGVVVYTGSRFMLWKSKESEYYGNDGGFDLDWVLAQDDEFVVIGNIFDNPELLTESNEGGTT